MVVWPERLQPDGPERLASVMRWRFAGCFKFTSSPWAFPVVSMVLLMIRGSRSVGNRRRDVLRVHRSARIAAVEESVHALQHEQLMGRVVRGTPRAAGAGQPHGRIHPRAFSGTRQEVGATVNH